MKLNNSGADIFVPDGLGEAQALFRTTALCIAAHQDDAEIMAYSAISQCYHSAEKWFTAIVLTDGSGSVRSGEYADYTAEQMKAKRCREQQNAAKIGRYAAVVQLGYSSGEVRGSRRDNVERDLITLLRICGPEEVYIHNPADRHETHMGACLRSIGALRGLPPELRPKHLYGMEVWRSLDWLSEADRLRFDTSRDPALAADIIAVYETQCTPQKRFDRAALGRRFGNATFQLPRDRDECDSCSLGLDMTPLLRDDAIDPRDFILICIDNFYRDVKQSLTQME